MAQSLTHVSYWNNGWKKISVEEASKMFPYGAEAGSHLFMCELCGHYVTLTKRGIYIPYFK